ncbi:MAG: hypothetical protein JWO42_2835 [Chloroflexi bacterium]|nr:hypothetical protein [Chloroflexota bacterium]
MHRYVALISPEAGPAALEPAAARFAQRFPTWRTVMANDHVRVWTQVNGDTPLGAERHAQGCLLGKAFATAESTTDSAPPPSVADLLQRRWGAYVAVQNDPASGSVEVLRDPTGRVECWRMGLTAGVEAVFSHYEDVRWLRDAPVALHWNYIRYHLHNDWCRGADTGLQEVEEILPGERVTFRPDGVVDRERAWRPSQVAGRHLATPAEAAKAMRRAAETSVSAWAALYDRLALDLSGGLDSAIVLGLLRRHAGHGGVVGVNWVTSQVEGDERAFARDVAKLHGIELIEVDVPRLGLDDITPFAGRLLRPSNRIMPLGYDQLAEGLRVRLGAQAYFSGTGGDHLFYDHLGAEAAADCLRRQGPTPRFFEAAYRLAQLSGETFWHVLAMSVRANLHSPRADARLERGNSLLTPEGQTGVDFTRFAHPWLTEAAHMPPAKLLQILNISELQRHYWRYGRADVADEVHPLFSQPLLEVCLQTPSDWFAADGLQRGLARRAFADLLPESIRTRRTKGANTSHWMSLLADSLPTVRETLMEGRLVAEGLLDRARMAAALQPLPLAAGRELMSIVRCLTTELWVRATEAAERSLPGPGRQAA